MRFENTRVEGARVVQLNRIEDDRGFFARAWCDEEFAAAGLTSRMRQANVATSVHAATLRGLHFQRAPYQEAKLVRCTFGRLFDVVVDLRPDSPTYLMWDGVELSHENGAALYVPEGCATGYITLSEGCSMYYQTSCAYKADAAWGIRYDDPAIGIIWPAEPRLLSKQDASWPYLEVKSR